jgi:hypothetical protein
MAFIEFTFFSSEQFDRLSNVFNRLREAKQEGIFPDDNYWLEFFDEQAQKSFWWPSEQELQEVLNKWRLTNHDPSTIPSWTFGSLIDAFKDGEYDLISCFQKKENLGRLEFKPLANPFGGSDCFHMLIRSFGCKVSKESGL